MPEEARTEQESTETKNAEEAKSEEKQTITSADAGGTGMTGLQPDNELAAGDSHPDKLTEEDVGGPLFSEEKPPSEAELMGTEEGEASRAGEEEKPPESDETPSKEDKPAEEKPSEDEKPKEDAKPKEDQVPEGYVPHAALHQERTWRQRIATENEELRQELADLKAKAEQPEAEEEDFKILSDEEFDELAEEDPAEAVKYERKLHKYLRDQEIKAQEDKKADDLLKQDKAVIAQSIERMEKAVPGLHDENSTINKDLTDFAIENGIEPEFLAAMTSPGTLILPPNTKNAVLLGNGAASLVEMVYKLYSASKENDPKTLREQITKEVEGELRQKITKELMEKFKSSGAEGSEFKSIGDLPGGETPPVGGPVSEAQFAKLPKAEQEKLLGA